MNRICSFTSVLLMTIVFNSGFCNAEVKSTNNNKATNSVLLNFDNTPNGELPAGAQVFTGSWAVRAVKGAPSAPKALCQSGRADYPAIALGGKTYSDVQILTSFKPISGKEDQAAGIIFRVLDEENYYILRANALEKNVVLFKYVKGKRISLKETSVKVVKGAWQDLRVEIKGTLIRGYLGGKLVIEATDATFKSGKVGLWTKADSQTCFDNVLILAH